MIMIRRNKKIENNLCFSINVLVPLFFRIKTFICLCLQKYRVLEFHETQNESLGLDLDPRRPKIKVLVSVSIP